MTGEFQPPPEVVAALEAWGEWRRSEARLLPAIGYPSQTAEASAGQGRGTAVGNLAFTWVTVEPSALVVDVQRTLQGLSPGEFQALEAEYIMRGVVFASESGRRWHSKRLSAAHRRVTQWMVRDAVRGQSARPA